MAKRANSEGSIYERSDGRWAAAVTTMENGRRKRVTRYAPTQAAARKLLTQLKGKQDAGQRVIFGRETLRGWLDEWLRIYVEPQRSPQTHGVYRDLLKRHVPEDLGKVEVAKVRPEDIQGLLNHLTAAGKGSTADHLRRVLRSAFSRALRVGKVPGNPVCATDVPRYQKKEGSAFTAEQAAALLKAAAEANDPFEPLFSVALYLGLRKAEITGLKPADLDLEGRRLHVQRSLFWQKTPGSKRGNGQWIEAPTKTRSTRTLPLIGPVFDALARQVARRQEEGKGEYLFVASTFAPINASSINKAWRVACKRAKVPVIRFHDARHSTGSMLHAAGASPFTIMEILGHSQISTTKRYTHTPVAVLEDALNKMGSAVEEAAKRLPAEQEQNRVAVSVAVN